MRTQKLTAKIVMAALVIAGFTAIPQAHADNCCPPQKGEIRGRTVVGAILSGLVWPGIGQAVNDNRGKKVATHAVLGLLPPYRIWSAYDALVDREGGYWNGKI